MNIRKMTNVAPPPKRNRPTQNLNPFQEKALEILSFEQWRVAGETISDQTLNSLWAKGLIKRKINPDFHGSEDIFAAPANSKYFLWIRRKA